ncbi:calcium-binding protein [Roseovarius sp. SCSIO 43702]|uniref:EF-hand domain-containing protein n=1 Tax=Roseovarius sp. SCSIO 43702 TaxID=2823043 RepID=UPI001C73DF81|nr:calcium-binding protein [Roseovarius sp. SCSIO 43702]QYX57919.1 calcium-binding protein [Roseovarius sp. SCSIO 43702]
MTSNATKSNIGRMILLATAVSLGYAGTAQAGPGGERPTFEALDADGDGKITRAEMQAHRDARFAEVDSDGDGKLSAAELEARMKARAERRAARMLERLDTDGDGAVSKAEMEARRGGDHMMRADGDGDGAISKAEFDAMKAQMKKRHGKKADKSQGE